MRTTLAALVIIGVASGASAQSPDVVELPEARSNPDGPVLSTGLPLPRIGLPLPQMGLRPRVEPSARVPGGRREGGKAGRRRGGGKGDHSRHPAPVAVAPYFWPYAVYEVVEPPVAEAAAPAITPVETRRTGTLYLDIQPASVQLFVDGYYVGTTDDVNGSLSLEAMPHRLEFRAPGHEPLALDVNIPADRATTYRGALKPLQSATRADAPPATAPEADTTAPTTFYVIPGCYVGNVPPKDAGLPATCDESRAVTVQR
jgi:hypothetical protein